MIYVDGEWLDHGDPRVDDIWRNKRIFAQPEHANSTVACRAILGLEDEQLIESAAAYGEGEHGCIAARMAYTAPKDLGHV